MVVAILLAPVVLPALLLGVTNPPSVSGAFYLLAIAMAWLGAVLGRRRRWRWVARLGWGLFWLTLVVRVLASGGERLSYERVGEARPWVATVAAHVAAEEDLAVGAARFFRLVGLLPEGHSHALPDAFRGTYAEMDEVEGAVPSPQLPTLLQVQSREGFDVLVHEGGDGGTLVFLHGFGGGVTAVCWQIAQAAADAGMDTLCPSMGTRGDWWTREGRAILEATLERAEGPIVLAGLSNGARGAAIQAPRIRRRIRGLILVSGAARDAGRAGVPTLVIQGEDDRMFSTAVVRGYARRTGARYEELTGGHFVFLTKRSTIRSMISAFLESRRST